MSTLTILAWIVYCLVGVGFALSVIFRVKKDKDGPWWIYSGTFVMFTVLWPAFALVSMGIKLEKSL